MGILYYKSNYNGGYPMSTYKVEICGVNTAQLPILKEEEKDELFKKIKAGDKASRETYIKGNLRLVLSVIKRFNNHNENVDDLFQIGCIGLMKAIDNFDTSVGVKFSTYAVPMIIGEIRRYLRDNSSYRIPRSLRDIAYKAMQAKERLAKNAQKEPTLEEIAAECEIPVEDVVYALDAIQTPLSLFDPVYTDGGDTLYVMDQISDKKNKEEHWVEDLSLSDALSHLNERDEHIIRLRFFEGKTQIEVADEIHISQAQVSRLEKKCVKEYAGVSAYMIAACCKNGFVIAIMWNIQNGEEKKYPAVENCILAFCGVLCYTVNRCRFCKQGIARKITECSRPSTRKTKLKETNGYERQKGNIYCSGCCDCSTLCSADFCSQRTGTCIPHDSGTLFRSTVYPACFYAGSDSGTVDWLSACESADRRRDL